MNRGRAPVSTALLGRGRERLGPSVRRWRLTVLARLAGGKGAGGAAARFDVEPVERAEINIPDDFHEPQQRKPKAHADPVKHRGEKPRHSERFGRVPFLPDATLILTRIRHQFSLWPIAKARKRCCGKSARASIGHLGYEPALEPVTLMLSKLTRESFCDHTPIRPLASAASSAANICRPSR